MKPENMEIPLTGQDFLDQMGVSRENRKHLVEGMIYEETLTTIVGDPGLGKSTLLTQIALQASAGVPVFDMYNVPRPLKVGFVINERSKLEFLERANEIHKTMPINADNIYLTDSYRILNMLKAEDVGTLLECFKTQMPDVDMIFFDPIYPMVSGGLSKDEPASAFCRAMSLLQKQSGAALVYSHHSPKDAHDRDGNVITKKSSMYGSQWLVAHSTGIFALKREEGENVLVREKDNYNILERKIKLDYNPETGLSYVSPSQLPNIDRFKAFLRNKSVDGKPFTFLDIETIMDLSTPTIRRFVAMDEFNKHLVLQEKKQGKKNVYKSTYV